MTIVSVPKGTPRLLNDALRAMPVTIPGRAIGRIRKNDTTSRPKKWKRWTANAARLPRTSATTIAKSATSMDRKNASRTSSLARASAYQFKVNCWIGQTWIRWALNE